MNKVYVSAILVVLLSVGCVDDQQTLLFSQICAQPVPSSTSCSYPAKCALFEGEGRLFFDAQGMLAAAGTAELMAQIEFINQLPTVGDISTGLLDGNDATIESFRLRYTVTSGTATLPFSGDAVFPQTFVVHSDSTLAPLVLVVPYPVGESIATLVGASFDMRVEIWARGHYKNGHAFEVGPFPVTVEVRNGGGPLGPACVAPKVPACCPVGNQGFFQTSSCACITL